MTALLCVVRICGLALPPPLTPVWVGRAGIYVFTGAYMLNKLQVLQKVHMGFYAV